MKKHYYIHVCCLFLKTLEPFSLSLKINQNFNPYSSKSLILVESWSKNWSCGVMNIIKPSFSEKQNVFSRNIHEKLFVSLN